MLLFFNGGEGAEAAYGLSTTSAQLVAGRKRAAAQDMEDKMLIVYEELRTLKSDGPAM